MRREHDAAPRPLMLQAKLAIGAGNDPLEHDAERVADEIMTTSGDPAARRERPQIQRFAGPAASPIPTDGADVERVLAGPARRLDPKLRAEMEQRFGHDFSQVRVHTDPVAERSAHAINANAYTVGHDIVFSAGRFAPDTHDGGRLLAHELTHVVQQRQAGGLSGGLIQREEAKTSTQISFPYAIRISEKLTSDDLLIEFIKQYRKIGSTDEVLKLKASENWHWIGPDPVVTAADVAKKFKIVTVTTDGVVPIAEHDEKAQKEAFAKLPPEQQKAINDQADQDFWSRTNYKPGQKLGSGADDKMMAKTWLQFRDRLVQEKGLIDRMPEVMKNIIANPQAYEPKDYEQLSRIISKLNTLSNEELLDYINRVTAVTTDLTVLENSVERYRAQLAERKQEATAREVVRTHLSGTEDLYDKYTRWKDQRAKVVRSATPHDVFGRHQMQALERADAMEAELQAELIKAGFPGGIPDFESMIRQFEAAFERESLKIADDILDRYAHVLFEAERKYQNDAEIDALHQQLAATGAKTGYQKSDTLESEARSLRQRASTYTVQGAAHLAPALSNQAVAKQDEAKQEREGADKSIAGLAGGHPLLADKKMDRRALAFADKAALKTQLLEYVRARREDIASSRKGLSDNPQLVYKADELLKRSYQLQNIGPNSIYDKIIRAKIADITIDEIIVKAVVGLIAIALGAITMGGGTVAVLAAAGAFGLSVYQAVEEYRDYETKSGLSGANLLSEDPSKFWVVASIVAAGLDLGAVAGTVKALSPALKVLDETNDVAKFEKSLAELASVDAKLRSNLVRAARDEVKYRESVKELMQVSGRAYAFAGVPDPELVWRMAKVAYAALKRGIDSFDKFLLELKAQKIIKNIEGLSAEERLLYKRAWLEALAEDTRLSKIQKIGEKLPINAEEFAGRTFSFDLAQNPVAKARMAEKYTGAELAERVKNFEDLSKKYPSGVKFSAQGFPDFKPYTVTLPNGNKAQFPLKTAGNRPADFAAADKMAGITEEYRQTHELVWHHVEDMQTIILIPRDVHGAVKHSGGVSVFKNIVIEE